MTKLYRDFIAGELNLHTSVLFMKVDVIYKEIFESKLFVNASAVRGTC